MPDIFLYRSQANVYTIVLSDPTVPSSGSSVTVPATGTAVLLSVGSVSVEVGITVNVSGNSITSSVRSVTTISTKPKITYGLTVTRSSTRKRRLNQ